MLFEIMWNNVELWNCCQLEGTMVHWAVNVCEDPQFVHIFLILQLLCYSASLYSTFHICVHFWIFWKQCWILQLSYAYTAKKCTGSRVDLLKIIDRDDLIGWYRGENFSSKFWKHFEKHPFSVEKIYLLTFWWIKSADENCCNNHKTLLPRWLTK